MSEQSPTHVVGFTFHKLAGTEPNYDQWAKVYLKGKLDNYGEEGKKERLRRMKAQFYTNFKNFSIRPEDEIAIVLPAKMEIVTFESRYLVNINIGASLDFIIKQTPERYINLVVPGLEESLKPVIAQEDFKEIRKASGYNFEMPASVSLLLRLKPVSVDAEKPIKIDGKEYWLMLMEFVTYEIWDANGTRHYWDYITEKQRKQKLDELRSLYKEEEENEEPQIIEEFKF